jgi:hypothetical protein
MSSEKRIAEDGEVWVCAACGKTWPGDRYDAPDASCFLYANLCTLESCKWVFPINHETGRGMVSAATSVDYNWRGDEGAEAPKAGSA